MATDSTKLPANASPVSPAWVDEPDQRQCLEPGVEGSSPPPVSKSGGEPVQITALQAPQMLPVAGPEAAAGEFSPLKSRPEVSSGTGFADVFQNARQAAELAAKRAAMRAAEKFAAAKACDKCDVLIEDETSGNRILTVDLKEPSRHTIHERLQMEVGTEIQADSKSIRLCDALGAELCSNVELLRAITDIDRLPLKALVRKSDSRLGNGADAAESVSVVSRLLALEHKSDRIVHDVAELKAWAKDAEIERMSAIEERIETKVAQVIAEIYQERRLRESAIESLSNKIDAIVAGGSKLPTSPPPPLLDLSRSRRFPSDMQDTPCSRITEPPEGTAITPEAILTQSREIGLRLDRLEKELTAEKEKTVALSAAKTAEALRMQEQTASLSQAIGSILQWLGDIGEESSKSKDEERLADSKRVASTVRYTVGSPVTGISSVPLAQSASVPGVSSVHPANSASVSLRAVQTKSEHGGKLVMPPLADHELMSGQTPSKSPHVRGVTTRITRSSSPVPQSRGGSVRNLYIRDSSVPARDRTSLASSDVPSPRSPPKVYVRTKSPLPRHSSGVRSRSRSLTPADMRNVPTDARTVPTEMNLSASTSLPLMSGVSAPATPDLSRASTPTVPSMLLQAAPGTGSNAMRLQPASVLTSALGLANHGQAPSAPQYFQESLQALQSLQMPSVSSSSDPHRASITRTSDLLRPAATLTSDLRPRSVTPERSPSLEGTRGAAPKPAPSRRPFRGLVSRSVGFG